MPSKNNDAIETILSKNGNELLKGTRAANEINDYFCNITVDLNKKFKDYNINYPTTSCHTKLELTTGIGVRELITDIKKIDESKSSGLTDLSTKILKIALLASPRIFLHRINRCLTLGKFPQVWKVSTTTPIPKKGNSKELKHLRPISILPLPGKILKKILNIRLMAYLEFEKLLAVEQGGFRK